MQLAGAILNMKFNLFVELQLSKVTIYNIVLNALCGQFDTNEVQKQIKTMLTFKNKHKHLCYA